MKPRLTSTILTIVATASAQIDAGGGKSAGGTITNHASLGGIVANTPQTVGSLTLRNGLIEVLYAAGKPIDPDADANSNGLPDSWRRNTSLASPSTPRRMQTAMAPATACDTSQGPIPATAPHSSARSAA